MPEKRTLERARRDKRAGKAPTTQAGEFVREEIEHVREGKHGARSAKQAIAIGLAKARRAGVKLAPPAKGKVSEEIREKAKRDLKAGEKHTSRKPAARRSSGVKRALERERHSSTSTSALSKQTRSSSRKRSAADRSAAARKAARTKGAAGRSAAARKGWATRRAKARARSSK
jgi:hypothetical protein